jgi:hypothetical protein
MSTYFTVTNGFIPFRLPLVDALSISFPAINAYKIPQYGRKPDTME